MSQLRAKALRKRLTPFEHKLWLMLKQLRGSGFHFRKQAPIGDYVVDFVCHRAKLVIEVDGGQHNDELHAERDAKRSKWLEQRGYRVLRFWNNDVDRATDDVMTAIGLALEEQRASFCENTPHA